MYYKIIERAITRDTPTGYTEKHHVIPRSIGGLNSPLVQITAKEHYVCHLLLFKMVIDSKHKRSMAYAIFCMKGRNRWHGPRFTGAMYSLLKEQLSVYNQGENNRFFGKGHLMEGEKNHFYGKKHTQKTIDILKEKCRIASLGEKNGFYGKHHTEETKQKISKFRTGCIQQSGPYRLIAPIGEEHIVREGIKTFCKDHDLVMSNVIGAAQRNQKTGRKYTTKGWTVTFYDEKIENHEN